MSLITPPAKYRFGVHAKRFTKCRIHPPITTTEEGEHRGLSVIFFEPMHEGAGDVIPGSFFLERTDDCTDSLRDV